MDLPKPPDLLKLESIDIPEEIDECDETPYSELDEFVYSDPSLWHRTDCNLERIVRDYFPCIYGTKNWRDEQKDWIFRDAKYKLSEDDGFNPFKIEDQRLRQFFLLPQDTELIMYRQNIMKDLFKHPNIFKNLIILRFVTTIMPTYLNFIYGTHMDRNVLRWPDSWSRSEIPLEKLKNNHLHSFEQLQSSLKSLDSEPMKQLRKYYEAIHKFAIKAWDDLETGLNQYYTVAFNAEMHPMDLTRKRLKITGYYDTKVSGTQTDEGLSNIHLLGLCESQLYDKYVHLIDNFGRIGNAVIEPLPDFAYYYDAYKMTKKLKDKGFKYKFVPIKPMEHYSAYVRNLAHPFIKYTESITPNDTHFTEQDYIHMILAEVGSGKSTTLRRIVLTQIFGQASLPQFYVGNSRLSKKEHISAVRNIYIIFPEKDSEHITESEFQYNMKHKVKPVWDEVKSNPNGSMVFYDNFFEGAQVKTIVKSGSNFLLKLQERSVRTIVNSHHYEAAKELLNRLNFTIFYTDKYKLKKGLRECDSGNEYVAQQMPDLFD